MSSNSPPPTGILRYHTSILNDFYNQPLLDGHACFSRWQQRKGKSYGMVVWGTYIFFDLGILPLESDSHCHILRTCLLQNHKTRQTMLNSTGKHIRNT
eukprot:1928049-Amphidinium_carterae.1